MHIDRMGLELNCRRKIVAEVTKMIEKKETVCEMAVSISQVISAHHGTGMF